MLKALLIYSPFAMKGRVEKKLNYIVNNLSFKYDVTVSKTNYAKHATQLASDACGVYDTIIIIGGDGLVNEVVNGVAEKETKPILALLPYGTVNDISRSLKSPRKLDNLLKMILIGNINKFDCFKTNNFYAFYVICSGKHTASTYKTKQKAKATFGWFAYFASAVKEIFSKEKHDFKIVADDEDLGDGYNFIMFINSVSVAGFRLNKKAIFNDGKFDIVLFKKAKSFLEVVLRYFKLIKMFLFGINSLKKTKGVIVKKVKEIVVYNNLNSNFNIDGECGNIEGKVKIEMLKEELTFIVK